MDLTKISRICRQIRYDILTSTTAAGSGHPTSSLSAVELMASLFFGGFYHFDFKRPKSIANDRFILSKGHASPLLYSLYHAAGVIDEKELMSLRKFGSPIEGHPNPRIPFVDVATGSLGQGLSNGVGMSLGINLRIARGEMDIKRVPKVWVLLGDSEMAEGQVWEALEIASYYKLANLVGIIDVNRLGQNGETESGWNIFDYQKKIEAFGWKTIMIQNGHNPQEIHKALTEVENERTVKDQRPTMIIARTIKGKGVTFLENKNGWHGKSLDKDQLKMALKEIGPVDKRIKGTVPKPQFNTSKRKVKIIKELQGILSKLTIYSLSSNSLTEIPTREAFGNALVELGEENQDIVVLDAEVANSTYENFFQKRFPGRFFEMFIAEENMAGVATGLSKIGFIPFISTFAAFFAQTFDQLRMAQYSRANLKIVGSHAGVSIGQDGPSQMGLEDLAMMRSILPSIVLYPSDAVSTKKLTFLMAKEDGIHYLRTTRGKTPVIYDEKEEFKIGGLKVHKPRHNLYSQYLVIAAGITLHEALKAQKALSEKGVGVTVVDLYSVKPFDSETIIKLSKRAKKTIVVEDHYPYGGIGEAIATTGIQYTHLCVKKTPMSGTPEELLHFEEIDHQAIVKAINSQ